MENVYFKGVERRDNADNSVWYVSSSELVTTLVVNDYLLADWCKEYRLTEKYSHIRQMCELFSWLRVVDYVVSDSGEDIPSFILQRLSDCVVSAYDSIAEALVLLDVADIRPIVARACGVQVRNFSLQRLTREEYLSLED